MERREILVELWAEKSFVDISTGCLYEKVNCKTIPVTGRGGP
jgi:hypothetical protein